MSWNQITQVECDHCHISIEIEEIRTEKVEADLSRRGWVITGEGQDLCEDCAFYDLEEVTLPGNSLRCRFCGHLVDECQCEPLGIGEDD